jgi:hypothetical protein
VKDTLRFVNSSGSCSDGSSTDGVLVGGLSDVDTFDLSAALTRLKPLASLVVFDAPGNYLVCIKPGRYPAQDFVMLGEGASPTDFGAAIYGAGKDGYSPTVIQMATMTSLTFTGGGLGVGLSSGLSGGTGDKVAIIGPLGISSVFSCENDPTYSTVVQANNVAEDAGSGGTSATVSSVMIYTAGRYGVCYQLADYKADANPNTFVTPSYIKMNTYLSVAGVSGYISTPSDRRFGDTLEFRFSGFGLATGASGDAVKFVAASVTDCATASAVSGTGTASTSLTSLSGSGATTALEDVSMPGVAFSLGGYYQICYKLSVSTNYELLTGLGTVEVKGPVSFNFTTGVLMSGIVETITVIGIGLDTRASYDQVYFVDSGGSCSSSQVASDSDLGPGDAQSQTSAEVTVTFSTAGSYKMCYKMASGSTFNLLDEVFTVTTPAPTLAPTSSPTTAQPTAAPTTAIPTRLPLPPSGTYGPTEAPTEAPTVSPTEAPTGSPTEAPTGSPTSAPTNQTLSPTTEGPTSQPTLEPTLEPTQLPTLLPTSSPTPLPTRRPTPPGYTWDPTAAPTTDAPTEAPTFPPGTYIIEPAPQGQSYIVVNNAFGMNVGNVLLIAGNGVSSGKNEQIIILAFGNGTDAPTARRLREDYEEDEEVRRLDEPHGPQTIQLTSPLVQSYQTADVYVVAADIGLIVGSDPVTHNGNTSIKFWLPNYELKPLLQTPHLTLSASTFPGPSKDLQWFERFVITSATGSPIVQVAIKHQLNFSRIAPPRVFSQLDINIKGDPIPLKTMQPIYVSKNGRELYQDYATESGAVQFRVGRQEHSPPRIYSRSYEYVYIQSPDLEFAIVPAHAANEFRSDWFQNKREAAYEYTHVDMMILHMRDQGNFNGILPQLWGVKPMSDEVRAMTVPPDGEESNATEGAFVCDGGCPIDSTPMQ